MGVTPTKFLFSIRFPFLTRKCSQTKLDDNGVSRWLKTSAVKTINCSITLGLEKEKIGSWVPKPGA